MKADYGNLFFLGNSRSSSSEVTGVKSTRNVPSLRFFLANQCTADTRLRTHLIDQQMEAFGAMTLVNESKQ